MVRSSGQLFGLRGEMVEALTIVLAAGVTLGWRSSLMGVGAALGSGAEFGLRLTPQSAFTPLTCPRPAPAAISSRSWGVSWES